MPDHTPSDLISAKEAAALTGFSEHTLAKWRSKTAKPSDLKSWGKIKGRVFYRMADLRNFQLHGMVQPGARAPARPRPDLRLIARPTALPSSTPDTLAA